MTAASQLGHLNPLAHDCTGERQMTKLSVFLVTMWLAMAAGADIIPYGSASAAPDGDAPASESPIPRGATISYDGDDVLIGMPGRSLFNLGLAGCSYFGFGGDGMPIIPLEPSSSDAGPDDFLTDLVGTDWLQ
jgi:hypothetical protein